MGFFDEMEKVKQAREWLKTKPVGSVHYQAAYEHLVHVIAETNNRQLRRAAQNAIEAS